MKIDKIVYDQSPKYCNFCLAVIPYEKRQNKFCNHSCCASKNNQGVAHRQRVIKIQKNCLNCNSIIYKKKYCSNKCQQNFQYKKWIEKWLLGKNDGIKSNGMAVSNYIKRWLIENFGNKCSQCDWSKINQTSGNVPIQVDHINGNSLDNKPNNLRLLCPNCHSLTPTYGMLNKGNGRSIRRKRYKKIKSLGSSYI